MIDKQKILDILNKESVSESSSNNNRIIIEQDFDIVADRIIEALAEGNYLIIPKFNK